LAAELQPELILMDIHMPERDGLEATRRIKQRFPQIKVVMLTVAAEDDLLLQALQYGASGYLLKNLPIPQFLSLLTDVMAGKTIVSPTLAHRVLTALAQADEDATVVDFPPADVLTPRQREVLQCIGQGMSNRQIAEALFISENTVKYHVGQIMKRLGLQTRHELIRYQLDHES
jgi:DNA-binding NarL/FixJ family response regulator